MKIRNILVGVFVGGVAFDCGQDSGDSREEAAITELERSPLKWYPNLCGEIHTALKAI